MERGSGLARLPLSIAVGRGSGGGAPPAQFVQQPSSRFVRAAPGRHDRCLVPSVPGLPCLGQTWKLRCRGAVANTMRVRVGCEFRYQTQAPVPMLMLVRARPDAEHQTLYESTWTEPTIPLREYRDSFGNPCWRLLLPEGAATIRYDAIVEVSPEPDLVVPDAPLVPVQDLPDDALVFTLPSRYIESDLLLDDAWQLFGDTPPTWARVQAICDWVHANVQYGYGLSGPTTTALDVFKSRQGVCRDFAQISVAMCRALNIPAR